MLLRLLRLLLLLLLLLCAIVLLQPLLSACIDSAVEGLG